MYLIVFMRETIQIVYDFIQAHRILHYFLNFILKCQNLHNPFIDIGCLIGRR